MHEPIETEPMPVRGRVRVELFDERTGRLQERVDGENFITVDQKAVMRWWQRMAFGAFSPGTPVADAYGTLPYYLPRQCNEHIAYWTDTAAEDPANEHRVNGEVIGWASRWPVGSPSGRRGVVDTASSVNGPGYSTWVFNWTSSQGNGGPFQSVGWTRLQEASAMPMPRFPDPDIPSITFNKTTTTTMAAGAWQGCVWWDAPSSKWVQVAYLPSSATWAFTTYPEAGGDATAQVTVANPPTWPTWVVKIGTDYVLGTNNQNNGGAMQRHNATGARLWIATNVPAGVSLRNATVDGAGKIWTAGSDGLMRRHTPTSGAVEVTVTPWRTPTELRGITYDAAADRFWISGIWSGVAGIARVASDGTLDGATFGLGAAQTVAASSPFPSYTIPATQTFDPWAVTRGTNNSSALGTNLQSPTLGSMHTATQAANAGAAGKYGGGLVFKGGTLYTVEGLPWTGSGPPQTCAAVHGISGHNIASRVRLSSPVTKTNTQNLRISYRFDFS